MNRELSDFPESLGYLTVVTGRLLLSAVGRGFTESGLDFSPEQWSILRMLCNRDGVSQEDLLRLTRYEKSTLSRVLDGMEKKELIERRRSDGDARRKQVFLTPKGAAGGAAGTEVASRTLALLYEGVSKEKFIACRQLIEEMQLRLLGVLRGEAL